MDFIRRRRLSVFSHIARLTQGTPAHNALHCQVGLASGRSLGRDWRRRPGRPRAHWTGQLRNDTICSCQPLETGHPTGPWWREATARAGYAIITTTQLKGETGVKQTKWYVFSRCLNVSRDGEEVMSEDKSFHIHAPATGKARRPTVESLTAG